MMKKIRVLDSNRRVSQNLITDRGAVIRDTLKELKLDDVLIESFVELDDYELQVQESLTSTNLLFITLKKILNYCYPVLNYDPFSVSTDKRNIDIDKIQMNDNIIAFVKLSNDVLKPITISKSMKFSSIGFVFPQVTNFDYLNRYFINNSSYEYNIYKYRFERFISIDKTHRDTIINSLSSNIEIEDSRLSKLYDKKHKIEYYVINSSSIGDIELYKHILSVISNYIDYYARNNILMSMRYQNMIIQKINKIARDKYTEFLKSIYDKANTYYHKILKLNDMPFIDQFNKISAIKINKYYYNDLINVLYTISEVQLYNNLSVYGYDSNNKQILDILKSIKYQNEQTAIINENYYKSKQNELRHTKIEWIARQTYPELFDTNNKQCVFYKNSEFDLNKIPKNKKESVLLLFKKREKLEIDAKNNKCEHIPKLQMYRRHPSVDTFEAIKKYVNDKSTDKNLLACKTCKYDILCPHELEYYSSIEKIKDKYNYEADLLIRNDIMEKYKSSAPINFIHYCDICSQEIGKNIDTEQYTQYVNKKLIDTGSTNILSDDDQKALFSTIIAIVNRYIDISQININVRKFVISIINIIKPFISDMRYKLNKSTISDSDKDIIININSIIYTYSCITLFSVKLNILLLKNRTGGRANDSKLKKELEIIKQSFSIAYGIIIKSNDFNKSKIAKDEVKKLLIEYYRNITNSDIDLIDSEISYNITKSIYNSNTYKSIYYFYKLIFNKYKNVDFDDIDKILKKPKNILIDIKNRKKYSIELYDKYIDNIFDSLVEVKDDVTTPINNRRTYLVKSYIHSIYLYISKGLYKISPFTPKDKLEKDVVALIDKYELYGLAIKQYESETLSLLRKINKISHFYLPNENSREDEYKLSNMNIFYCLDGDKHRFMYIHKSANQIDIICKKCNVDISKVLKQSDKDIKSNNTKILDNIKEKGYIESFFEIYVNICPKGDNHIFDTNKKCKKCNTNLTDIYNRSIKYYDSYKSVFSKQLTIKNENLNNEIETIIQVSKPTKIDMISKLKDINFEKIDYDINELINIISKKYNKKPYLLKYLGLLDNIDYHNIDRLNRDNKLNDVTEENISYRKRRLCNYNNILSNYYNIIRFSKTSLRINDLYVTKFIDKHKSITEKIYNLPPLELNSIAYYNKYIDTDDITINKVLLYTLLKNIVGLVNLSLSKLDTTIIDDFINMVLDKFIYQDRLFTQYSISDLKLTDKPEKDIDILEEVDFNKADAEEENNIFSYDYLDIDDDLLDDDYDLDADID